MSNDHRVLGDSISQLAEGPIWVPDAQQVWWIDVFGGVLHRVSWPDGNDDPWEVGERLAFAIPTRVDDRVILGLADRVVLTQVGSRDWTHVAGELDGGANTSINDAKCDPRGRLWFGTLDNDLVNPVASLSCAPDARGAATRLSSLTISNGLGWSPDGRTMYLIDSAPHVLLAMSYDVETGTIGEPSTLVSFGRDTGLPDGLSVDRAGDIWVAMYGGGAMRRYTSDGAPAEVRTLPVSHPTSCCFVGDDLDQLLVTTSAWAPEEPGELDGASFVIDVDTPGLPVSFFVPGI
jgi:sugar lactone lactonase YvrE